MGDRHLIPTKSNCGQTNTDDDIGDPYSQATDHLLDLLVSLNPHLVADVGCGDAGVTFDVAQVLPYDTTLYAIDHDPTVFDPPFDEHTRAHCTIMTLVQEVNELALPTEVDVLLCRFLLLNLVAPLAAVERMRQWVRPGGHLVLMEPITSTGRVEGHPLSVGTDEIANPDIGLRLCELLADVGVNEPSIAAFTPVGLGGSLAGRYLAAMTGVDPDPASFVSLPTLVLACGQVQ